MIKPSRELANAAGQDAGNRNARKHGRKRWNEDDWNVAARTYDKVWPRSMDATAQQGE